MANLSVKVVFEGDVRRVRLLDALNLSSLRNLMLTIYRHKLRDDQFVLKYHDEEGDLVSLCNDGDLAEAILQTRKRHPEILRLQLLPSLQDKAISAAEVPEPARQNEVSVPEPSAVITTLEQPKRPNTQSTPHVEAKSKAASCQSDQELETVHPALCDNCNSRIYGVRYKCSVCPNYDLCSKCEAQNIANNIHIASHCFLKMYNSPNQHPVITHLAICDYCGERIVGHRYKCVNCADFDLCQLCEYVHSTRLCSSQIHNPDHMFLKVSQPVSFLDRFSPLPVYRHCSSTPAPNSDANEPTVAKAYLSELKRQRVVSSLRRDSKPSSNPSVAVAHSTVDKTTSEDSAELQGRFEKRVPVDLPSKGEEREVKRNASETLGNDGESSSTAANSDNDGGVSQDAEKDVLQGLLKPEVAKYLETAVQNAVEMVRNIRDRRKNEQDGQLEENKAPQYEEQMTQLHAMGFECDELNKRLLCKYKGDIIKVIEHLCD